MADVVKIVDNGLAITTALLAAISAVSPKWVGWGIGTTEPVVGNTALESAGAEARTVGTQTQQTTTTTNDTYQVVALITCTGSGKAITEVGVFNHLTNNDLFLRATFSAINVSVNDSIQFTIKTVFDNP